MIWKNKSPRIKLKHFQRPKDNGGLALPNPWLYYLAAQLQHLVGCSGSEPTGSSQALMLHTVGDRPIPMALEALAFAKPNKKYPTYNQKV